MYDKNKDFKLEEINRNEDNQDKIEEIKEDNKEDDNIETSLQNKENKIIEKDKDK